MGLLRYLTYAIPGYGQVAAAGDVTGAYHAPGFDDAGKLISKGVSTAAGQSNFHAGTQELPFAPDADNPVVKGYQDQKDALMQQMDWASVNDPGKMNDLLAQYNALAAHPPSEWEIKAGAIQGDRARIIGAGDKYNPLIDQLQQAAAGQGPSAAQDTMREGTDRAVRGAYGMAASGNVMPGQRAALLGQAVGASTDAQTQGARDAAVLRAQEIQGARSQLGQAIGSQAQTYQPLYAGDQEANLANQAGFYHAQDTNAGIQTSNAQEAGKTTRSVMDNAAKVFSHGGGGSTV